MPTTDHSSPGPSAETSREDAGVPADTADRAATKPVALRSGLNAEPADGSDRPTAELRRKAMDAPNLKNPDFYINRYESLLQFNFRVLAYAKDETVPLLERLRYLCISSSNLDEFFEIRVAVLKQRVETGSVQSGPDNQSPAEILRNLSRSAQELVAEQYATLNDDLIPAFERENIFFLKRTEWTEEQEIWLRRYFDEQLAPVLSPLGLDPAHPFPKVLNKSLNFIVSLSGKDAFGRDSGMAVVQAPRSLPRVIKLPEEIAGECHAFVFLSSIIHAYVDDLFPGMESQGCYQFRVTRNSDLFVDEEEIVDLARALEGELDSRRYGDEVRMEVADNCPDDLTNFLLHQFDLTRDDLYKVNGPVNLNRLLAVCDLTDRADLKFPGFRSGLPARVTGTKSVFEAIAQGDMLLHHPYESFVPVIDLVRQAASDVRVVAIKQTLYRTGPGSAIVEALVEAARAGKEVTVVIELRARFDEAENIELANALQEAGAHVVYGVVGYKTHAKMLMVVRREGKRLRRYVHLGTGNYHPRTARLYTDYGLLTCDSSIGQDVHRVFMQLTSLGKVSRLNQIVQSPFKLHDWLISLIDREIEHAGARRKSRIIIKVNSVAEPKVIQALYRASQAGVKVDLVVRGMCAVRPGIPGVSENIQVRSVVGRFLEHTRVYYFRNGGEDEVYCASADLLERNLFRRVEVAFPIRAPELQKRIIAELELYLSDNTQAWELGNDGRYTRCEPGTSEPVSAQRLLLSDLAESS